MEFFIFLILFLCVFLPSWNILCSATEYIRDRQEVVTQSMDSLDGIYQRTSRIVNTVDERLGISEYISYAKDLAIEYPLTAVCTFIVLGTVALPVLTFVFFALATVAVTFVGFLFVNGTVLTVAGVVFGGVICTFGAVAVGIGAVVAGGYYSVAYAVSVVRRFLPASFASPDRAPGPATPMAPATPATPDSTTPRRHNGVVPSEESARAVNGHCAADANGHQNGWEKVG